MALSGLEIYKLLPKTNCKKCGFQTCLAFAMQLARKAVPLDKCPFVSENVRVVLEEASLPAIRPVTIGTGAASRTVGKETVLFRHEEKFHHPTAIGILVEAGSTEENFQQDVEAIKKLSFERVGQKITVDLVALDQQGCAGDLFAQRARLIVDWHDLGLVLIPSDADSLRQALALCSDRKPLVYCRDSKLVPVVTDLCVQFRSAIAVRGADCDQFASLTKEMVSKGVNDVILAIAPNLLPQKLWQLTQLRRLAIRQSQRALGFPTLAEVDSPDAAQALCEASVYVTKYASIVLLREKRPEFILPLLTLRQDIFTDPQKPLQVQAGVYPVGTVTPQSPVLVTTNFSLTYYSVLSEIESSRVPCYLLCLDTEGMSVLTAWAADKFSPEKISDSLVRFKAAELVSSRRLVIPGYVSVMSGELEEKSGWTVFVGPKEAAGIPSYLKTVLASGS